LELAFSSVQLRIICENESHAKKELGSEVALVLKRRLADLAAAKSIQDLVVGDLRYLDGLNKNQMTIDLCDGHRLVFSANHPTNLATSTHELNWQKVSRLKLLRIENEHS